MILDKFDPEILLRLMQERETLLAYLREEKTAGSDERALQKIESECLRRIGVPLGVIRRTPPRSLIELMQGGGMLTFRSIILAELLLQDAELGEKVGDLRSATGSRLQAYCLIAESVHVLSIEEQADYRSKLKAIAMQLESISDDPYLRATIKEYAAKAGL